MASYHPTPSLVLSSFLICLCLILLSRPACTHDLVQSVNSVWSNVVSTAAEEAIKSIRRKTGQDRHLESVPMDSLRVFIGRTHHLALEIGGTEYEVTLGAQDHSKKEQAQLPESQALGRGSSGQELVSHDLSQRGHKLTLPEITITGPLELVLNEPQSISVYLPNSADVGIVRRIQLAAGATVKVSSISSITLRRPVDLPRLPGQYLAEIYASIQVGEPEREFHLAPGIQYLAANLRQMANNQTGNFPLLSFDVEPAAFGSLSIVAEAQGSGASLARLKVKKIRDGTIGLSVRNDQIPHMDGTRSLTHLWAWPLPHVPTSSWLSYESVLRGMLASHAFDINDVAENGIPLKLTKSSIKGVSMMAFDMYVRAQENLEVPEEFPFPKSENKLEIWEVMVQVQEDQGKSKNAASRFKYLPLSAKLKEAYGNTLSLSGGLEDPLFIHEGGSQRGFESEDLGMARFAL